MKLYLVQHAEARSKDEDPERPLSDEGRGDIEKVAAFAAGHASIRVARILHSGKTRARQTAEVIAARLGTALPVQQAEGLEPLAESSIWADRLGAEKGDTMLVGHLPHLSKLASRLLCGNEEIKTVDYRMGGIVCLERDDTGNWAVNWMLTPDML